MRLSNTLVGILLVFAGSAQTKPGTSFYTETNARVSLCPERRDALSETDVNDLISDILWKSYHIKNSFIIINCTEVANCQAAMFNGKSYILYNANFLGRIKKLNFSEASLAGITDKNWETLTILAHELGHHLNGHLANPMPDATQWGMELEADETAGFIVYMMGGTLEHAQLPFKEIPEQGTYTHPGRQKRLEAIAKGWNDGNKRYPKSVITSNKGDNPVTNGAATETDIVKNVYPAEQNDTKIAWAFPITDYMVALNDSTKIVQVLLTDAFPVKEKQLGVMRGTYNSSHEDTVQKGYGRCHLIKGDYYYFTIGNNKSGVAAKQGDLLYALIDKPAVYNGQALKIAAHYIEFDNVYDQPLFDRVNIYFQWAVTDEKKMIDSAVSDIKFTGNYFLTENPSMNEEINKGPYKGHKILTLMTECNASQVKDFMAYIIARPHLYAGRKWKISEIFATWLTGGAPTVVK